VRGAAGTVVSPALPGPGHATPDPAAPNPAASHVWHDGAAPRPLQLGLPALDAFPRKAWARIAAHELRRGDAGTFSYPHPHGHHGLRERIATYLGISRGVPCQPDQVFITAGYRASLELILRAVAEPGGRMWFEDPGYFLASGFLRDAGVALVSVPVDEHGLDVAAGVARAPDARLALVTPANQSPLGVTLSLERRIALLDWAQGAGSWIVEDDYDSEFRYQGRPLPALKSIDRADRVLYCGTFSKVMFPGLRLAYLVVPRSLVDRFAQVSAHLNAGAPVLYQAALAEFIGAGHFFRHLKKMRGLYAERRLLAARVMGEVCGDRLAIDPRPGGLHMLARLPAHVDDAAVARRARIDGLGVQCLSQCYQQAAAMPGLMFGFANIASAAQARELALRLRAALDG
jgi:GntR family transcriptional regulator/MocR family aminotransferase